MISPFSREMSAQSLPKCVTTPTAVISRLPDLHHTHIRPAWRGLRPLTPFSETERAPWFILIGTGDACARAAGLRYSPWHPWPADGSQTKCRAKVARTRRPEPGQTALLHVRVHWALWLSDTRVVPSYKVVGHDDKKFVVSEGSDLPHYDVIDFVNLDQ